MEKNRDPLNAPEIRYRFKSIQKRGKRTGIDYLFHKRTEIEMLKHWETIKHDFV
jgi:hypothetical protein